MKWSTQIATLFGIGRVPLAPGTVASLLAFVLAFPLAGWGGRLAVLMAGIVASAIGAWAAEHYARDSNNPNPSECVIDELAGQWIACAFAPFTFWAFLLAFILFRFFDIVKPWPISRLERLHGGLGIMADDLGAALASGAIIAVLAHARLL